MITLIPSADYRTVAEWDNDNLTVTVVVGTVDPGSARELRSLLHRMGWTVFSVGDLLGLAPVSWRKGFSSEQTSLDRNSYVLRALNTLAALKDDIREYNRHCALADLARECVA